MDILELLNTNITVVYKDLVEVFISRDFIKKSNSAARIIEGPDNLLIVDFDKTDQCKLQARYDSRRLYVDKHNSKTEDEANFDDVSHLSCILEEAVSEDGKEIIAYGYNFNGIAAFPEKNALNLFINHLIKSPNNITEKLKAKEIIRFIPELQFEYEEFKLNVKLTPMEEDKSRFIFNINIHIQSDDFPNEDKVRQQINELYKMGLEKMTNLFS